MKQMKAEARSYMKSYRKTGQCGLILRHGHKRLGVVFFSLQPDGATVKVRFPLLERELFGQGFFAEFLRRIFCNKIYPDRRNFELVIPKDLKKTFGGFLKALGDHKLPIWAVNSSTLSDVELASDVLEYNVDLRYERFFLQCLNLARHLRLDAFQIGTQLLAVYKAYNLRLPLQPGE